MNIKRPSEHSANRLREILRSFIGKGAIPVQMVEELTGIPASTIYSHMDAAGNKPNSDHMLAYIQLFGVEFLNAWTQQVGITGAYRPKGMEGCRFKTTLHTQTVVTDCLGSLSRATEDGRIDHIEAIEVPKILIATAIHINKVAANYERLN